MAEDLQFAVDTPLEDWRAAVARTAARTRAAVPRQGQLVLPGVWVGCLLVAVAAKYLTATDAPILDGRSLILIGGTLVVVGGVSVWSTRRRRKAVAEALLPRAGGAFLGHYAYVAAADGLHAVGPFGECRYDWRVIQRVDETDEHVFVFADTSNVLVLPKRCLQSPTPGEVRAEIERHARAAPGGALRATGAS